MFIIDKYSPAVYVDLDNGVYQFDCYSATGKTRLYELLKEYNRAGESVVAYSYNDWVLGLDLKSVLSRFKPKLIIVDRYNMFNTEYHQELESAGKESIVLIDSKEMLKFGEYDRVCGINIQPDKIEVYG